MKISFGKKYFRTEWLVPILITLASFNGLVKAMTGVRYGPLVIDAAIFIITCLIVVARVKDGQARLQSIDFWVAGFVLLAALGIFHPNIPSLQAGLEGFRKFAFMILGFFIGRYWIINMRSLRWLIRVLIVLATFLALYGIKQFIFPSSLDFRLIELSSGSPTTYLMGGHLRAFSTLAGPFHLGIYMVCSLSLLMSLAYHYRRYRFGSLIIGSVMLIALVMTVTKSNWFAVLASGLFLILLNSRNPFKLVGLFALVLILTVIALETTRVLAQNTPELRTVEEGLQAFLRPWEAPTFQFRVQLWQEEVLPMMLSSPIIGLGTGSAGEGLGYLFEGTASQYVTSHSLYLKVQIELGLIGFLFFMLILLDILRRIFKTRQRLKDKYLRAVSDWVIIFAVGVAVSGLTGAILDAYPVNWIFWILLGVATRLQLIEQARVSTTAQSDEFAVIYETGMAKHGV